MTAVNDNVPFGISVNEIGATTAVLHWKTKIKRGYFFKIYASTSAADGFTLIQTTSEEKFNANIAVATPNIKYVKVSSVRVTDSLESSLSTVLEIPFADTRLPQSDRDFQTIHVTDTTGEVEDLVAEEWVTAFSGSTSAHALHPKALVALKISSAFAEGGSITGLKMKIDVADNSTGTGPTTIFQESVETGSGELISFLHHIKIGEGMFFFIKFTADTAVTATIKVDEVNYVNYVGSSLA